MPGSRPDVPEVWFMVKQQDFFSLHFVPAVPVACSRCFQMILIAHLSSVPSCYVVSSGGNGLLLASFFPGYKRVCLKPYWYLVDSGPFLALTVHRILYAALQLNATEVSDEAEPQLYPAKSAPAQLPWPTQEPGWAEGVFPISLPCRINSPEQCSLGLPISDLCLAADAHMKITPTIFASDTARHRNPIATWLGEELKAHSDPKCF